MGLTSSQMVQRIKDRTHQTDIRKILGELNSAKDWVFNELFKTEKGPDQLVTYATEITLAAITREYDLGAHVTGTIYGIKTLWVRFSNETTFTPAQPADPGSRDYIFNDAWTAADTTVAISHPVLFDVVNFSKVRFAPQLASGTYLRVDFWRKAPDIDDINNNTLAYGDDIPEPLHEAILSKATGLTYDNIDDSRAAMWEARAKDQLTTALYVVQRREQGPTRITGFRGRRRRFI